MSTGAESRLARRALGGAPARLVDVPLAGGLAGIAVLGMLLRSVNVAARPIGTDEPTIVNRAVAVAHGELIPPAFDYPPLPAYVVGSVLRVVAWVRPTVLTDDLAPYVVGRGVFIALSGLLILLVGLLGAAVVRDPIAARLVGLGSAAAVAVSYLAVRLGSMSKPDVLQMVFAVGCVLASVLWVRRAERRWLLAAGALAGLAAASKYAGVLAVVPLGVLLLLRGGTWGARAGQAAVVLATTAAGFLAGTLATPLTHMSSFVEGFTTELVHQAAGHLGYEPSAPGWWFHTTTSLPGNWGALLTAVGLVGAVWALGWGTDELRLVGAAALLLFAFTGASQVQFPHYVLLPVPFLAVAGWAAAVTAGRALGGRRGALVVVVVLALSLVPSALDSARLVRAWGAPDTRTTATQVQQSVGERLHVEQYTGRHYEAAEGTFAFGFTPEVVDCRCVVAISSYQEERFRRRPDLYAEEVAVYDAIRARGEVLAVVGPDVPLTYRWDLLPQWGAGELPVLGDTGPVGPTITIIDLRS